MSIQEGFNELEEYFAPINKGVKRVFLGSPKEKYDEYEPVFEAYEEDSFVEDEPVFDSFDTEDY